MNKANTAKIVEDYLKAIEFQNFQDFCNRLLIKLYPQEFIPVRAAGRWGDMKNDGYCYISRTFFQAHATRSRNEDTKAIELKIQNDLEGCLAKQKNVKEFIYITNDILTGKIENFIDSLREKHKPLNIETWGFQKLALLVVQFEVEDIEYIIDRNLSEYKEISASQQLYEQLEKLEQSFAVETDIKETLLIFFQIKRDYNQQKAALIQRFPIPNNTKDLIEFSNFCISNFKSSKVNFLGTDGYAGARERLVNRAWKAKSEQTINKLKLKIRNEPIIKEDVEKLEMAFHLTEKNLFDKIKDLIK